MPPAQKVEITGECSIGKWKESFQTVGAEIEASAATAAMEGKYDRAKRA
jgi:hypothetical protein